MAVTTSVFSEEDFASFAQTFLEEGGSLGRLRGLNDTDLEQLYSAGYFLYDHGNHEKASDVFRFLCFYDQLKKRNWMGLGAACQMGKKYEAATKAYAMAVVLDYKDPWPHLHAGECFLSANNRHEAKNALLSACHFAGETKVYRPVKARAEHLLETNKLNQKKEQ